VKRQAKAGNGARTHLAKLPITNHCTLLWWKSEIIHWKNTTNTNSETV